MNYALPIREDRQGTPRTHHPPGRWVYDTGNGDHRAERTNRVPNSGGARPVSILDGGVYMSKRIFLAMASLAALVLSSGANATWFR